ncbi:MAG TPA: hypothetical protein DDY57_15875 [Franconibacter pulveris]|nr:hypothetical protein [Franconibacter pulveris]
MQKRIQQTGRERYEMCDTSKNVHPVYGFSCAAQQKSSHFLKRFSVIFGFFQPSGNAFFLRKAETIHFQQARRPCSSYLFRISIPAPAPTIKKKPSVRLLTRW